MHFQSQPVFCIFIYFDNLCFWKTDVKRLSLKTQLTLSFYYHLPTAEKCLKKCLFICIYTIYIVQIFDRKQNKKTKKLI